MNDANLINLIYQATLSDDWQPFAAALRQALDGVASIHNYGHDLILSKVTSAAHAGRSQYCRELLAAVFGLTQAEIELALALGKGTTLRHHAQQRSVSLHTVRNQLKSIFDKTGVHRQAELVSLLGRLEIETSRRTP